MVIDYWKSHFPLLLDSHTECFAKKLLCLKHKTIDWAREKRVRDDHLLNDIEFELANLVGADGRVFESAEEKDHLIKLEAERNKILKDKEET